MVDNWSIISTALAGLWVSDENHGVNDEDDDLDVDGDDENHDDDGDDDVNGDDDNVAAHLWVWAFNSSKARVKGPWILLNALPSARDDDDGSCNNNVWPS